jgi:ribosomal-protein-alanine N-acetyltransferase
MGMGTDMGMGMDDIDAGRLLLRPVPRDVALALLAGRRPAGLSFAPGYPSEFSLETMQIAAGPSAARGFGPFFMVRKADEAVIGELGAIFDPDRGTAHVGYTVVQPSWGRGYATEAVQALLAHLRTRPGVRRVLAETLTGHTASRRVMEKAGMTPAGERVTQMDGRTVSLVVYELAHEVGHEVGPDDSVG